MTIIHELRIPFFTSQWHLRPIRTPTHCGGVLIQLDGNERQVTLEQEHLAMAAKVSGLLWGNWATQRLTEGGAPGISWFVSQTTIVYR